MVQCVCVCVLGRQRSGAKGQELSDPSVIIVSIKITGLCLCVCVCGRFLRVFVSQKSSKIISTYKQPHRLHLQIQTNIITHQRFEMHLKGQFTQITQKNYTKKTHTHKKITSGIKYWKIVLLIILDLCHFSGVQHNPCHHLFSNIQCWGRNCCDDHREK